MGLHSPEPDQGGGVATLPRAQHATGEGGTSGQATLGAGFEDLKPNVYHLQSKERKLWMTLQDF